MAQDDELVDARAERSRSEIVIEIVREKVGRGMAVLTSDFCDT